jgi:transposase
MAIELNEQDWRALEQAQAGERRVRHWRRYQAIRLLAQGQGPRAVAVALGCRLSSVYNWLTAWKRDGAAGLVEARHGGRPRRLVARAEPALEALLTSDPQAHGEQATGWTVPLLQTHLAQAGFPVSDHTLRRTLRRLGWRWKRPRYELGRPDPADEAKKGASWSR